MLVTPFLLSLFIHKDKFTAFALKLGGKVKVILSAYSFQSKWRKERRPFNCWLLLLHLHIWTLELDVSNMNIQFDFLSLQLQHFITV